MTSTTVKYRPFGNGEDGALKDLRAASTAEGFQFIERLVTELANHPSQYEGQGVALLGGYALGQLVAIGGFSADPYTTEQGLGRLRRVYVLPAWRGMGVGRHLVRTLEAQAAETYRALVLRTDTAAAARFYEALGYAPFPAGGTATHRRSLVPTGPVL
jgi:GNAT superfamily N-acetyltransferase